MHWFLPWYPVLGDGAFSGQFPMKPQLFPALPILMVDDEQEFLETARLILRSEGITNVEIESDSRQALGHLAAKPFGIVAVDLTMPHVSGQDLLDAVGREYPDIVTLVISGINDVATAVDCMKKGAFDYLLKPMDRDKLVTCIKRAIAYREQRAVTAALKRQVLATDLRQPAAFNAIITASGAMFRIFQYAETIGPTDLPVLITGETGTGKELLARALHEVSGRTGKFVPVNVAGVDDNVFTDTLFGHRRGAFTGADQDRPGLIETATGGTLSLDEIGDLRPESQVKLLRLLQEGSYYPLGADTPKVSRARVVVSTNVDLENAIAGGKFRKDLYYRLEAHQIVIPPLRQRLGDLSLLVDHFSREAAGKFGKNPPKAPTELFRLLANHDFSGNIRELQGMVSDAVSQHADGPLPLEPFQKRIQRQRGKVAGATEAPAIRFTGELPTLEEAEDLLIAEALRRTDGNKTQAAKMLGLNRQTLINRASRSE
jgi:DNA-binding NtrC family response regulator